MDNFTVLFVSLVVVFGLVAVAGFLAGRRVGRRQGADAARTAVLATVADGVKDATPVMQAVLDSLGPDETTTTLPNGFFRTSTTLSLSADNEIRVKGIASGV